MPAIRAIGGASLYSATSYSRRPGVSSTTPETRAPWGLDRTMSVSDHENDRDVIKWSKYFSNRLLTNYQQIQRPYFE